MLCLGVGKFGVLRVRKDCAWGFFFCFIDVGCIQVICFGELYVKRIDLDGGFLCVCVVWFGVGYFSDLLGEEYVVGSYCYVFLVLG